MRKSFYENGLNHGADGRHQILRGIGELIAPSFVMSASASVSTSPSSTYPSHTELYSRSHFLT
ncbi:hypothetical protein SAMN05216316_2712 [Nitrosovibrio sp. Nv6]|nr:hypothetical protein SAMN05216316_2712 [Nitrosovibrio sp. Nv6]